MDADDATLPPPTPGAETWSHKTRQAPTGQWVWVRKRLPHLYSVNEAAEALGRTPRWVRDALRQYGLGVRLPSATGGDRRRWVLRRQDYQELVAIGMRGE